jgi:transcriptional regulator with XRE-family HTH domain
MIDAGKEAGERPAIARRRRGLPQLRLADMIGCGESGILKIETGVICLDSPSLATEVLREFRPIP